MRVLPFLRGYFDEPSDPLKNTQLFVLAFSISSNRYN